LHSQVQYTALIKEKIATSHDSCKFLAAWAHMPDHPGTSTFRMHPRGFGGQYNFIIMERDGCYLISDKKPRRDRLRWEGHTEKVGTVVCGKLILSLLWKTEKSRTYYCGECR